MQTEQPLYILIYAVFVKGGMPGSTTLRDCKTLESIVRKQAAEGQPYAAICAAPAVALGSWGLLKGLKVRTKISLMCLLPYGVCFYGFNSTNCLGSDVVTYK